MVSLSVLKLKSEEDIIYPVRFYKLYITNKVR